MQGQGSGNAGARVGNGEWGMGNGEEPRFLEGRAPARPLFGSHKSVK